MKKHKSSKVYLCLGFVSLFFMIETPTLYALDIWLSFSNNGGTIYGTANVTYNTTRNFEVNGVKAYVYTKWYMTMDGVEYYLSGQDDNSGILGIDPDINIIFNSCSTPAFVKAKIYEDASYTDLNSTYIWTVTVVGGEPATTIVSGGGTYCTSKMLTATGGLGGTIYYQGTISNGISTANATTSFTITSSGTYYFRSKSTYGCWGDQGSATVTIKTSSTAPTSASASPNPVCKGSSVTLYKSGGSLGTGATWEWRSGSCDGDFEGTGSSISVAPSSTKTYYVRAKGDCNTTLCASITVTVINPSTAPTGITVSSSTVCSGSTVTLTRTGGSLGTGADWEWYSGSCGGSYLNKTGTTISVNPTSTTTYYVRAEGDCNNTSCASTTITVTPNASIGSVTGTTPLCIGSSATYTANPVVSGGGSGEWTSSNPAVATVVIPSSGFVTAAGAGTCNIIYTITGGCGGTVSKSQQLTVNPNNTITLTTATGTNDQSLCINTAIQTIRYSTTGATGAPVTGLPDGVTGSWSLNTLTISGTPTNSGTFNYTVSLTGGCGNVTASGKITVKPDNTISLISSPGTDNQTACINAPITNIRYSTTGATNAGFSGLLSGVTGKWENNVVTISGTPTQTGVSDYSVTLTEGCGTVTATGKITVNANNTITLSSPAGTINQTLCINTPITEIKYSTTGATGATVTGLPQGVTGLWASDMVTISGTPAVSGTFKYTVTLTEGCGDIKTEGNITVTPDNTITLTSGSGSNNQYACINTPITPITFATTGAAGAQYAGLPSGVNGNWAAGVITISGTPVVFGTFDYTITLTEGCGDISATGKITVNPDNTIILTSATGTINQSVCINTSLVQITYTTTGATNATFSGFPAGLSKSFSSNTVTISGISSESGTFNYEVTLTGGCGLVTASGTMTVKPDNTITLTSGTGTDAQSICENIAITPITYSTSGAENVTVSGLPADLAYEWKENILSINGKVLLAGSYNYIITLTGGCGSITKNGTINVKPLSTLTLTSPAGTDNQAVCINSAITSIKYSTTTATGAGVTGLPEGVSGVWAANVVTISGIPSASNTYNYSVTPTGGCGDVSATGIINVKPRPSIASIKNGSHCGPGEVLLEAIPGSGVVKWYTNLTGGASLAEGNNYTTLSLNETQEYYVDATADGCTTQARTSVAAVVLPVYKPSIVLKWGDVLICSNKDTLFTNYQWVKNDSDLSDANKQYFLTAKSPGNYKVRVTDINGCTTTSDAISISGPNSLKLYPNPARECVTIMLEEEITGRVNIVIINGTGTLIREYETVKVNPGLQYELPVSELEEGVYLIRLIIDNKNVYNSNLVIIK